MKFLGRLFWIGMVVLGLYAWRYLLLPQLPRVATDVPVQRSAVTTSSSQPESSATPIEAIVRGKPLANVYYYRFDRNVPEAQQALFQRAVAVYNQTGIIKLIAGVGTELQNTITFSVYHKTMPANTTSFELGKGGPRIVERWGAGESSTVNHATAAFNITYASQTSESVAIHEIGHAVGLDHSRDRQSVMYPVDQGVTRLSTDDIAGLAVIYPDH